MKSNQLPRVPGLKEKFVYRDSWTRLNVKRAKIMQVLIVQSCTGKYAYALCMHALTYFFCSYVSKSMCYQSWESTLQHNRHQQMQAVYWSPLCTLRHVMLFSKGGFSGKVYLLRLWTTPFWKVWLLATNTSPSGWIESWKQVSSYIALLYHTSVFISIIIIITLSVLCRLLNHDNNATYIPSMANLGSTPNHVLWVQRFLWIFHS